MPINNKIQLRRGTSSEWASINSGDGPVLAAGEPGFQSDSNLLKIGDGSTAWKDLKLIGSDQSLYKVKNTSGGIIYKGQVVRANGTVGNSDAIQVTTFIADGSVPEYTLMGLATQDMNNNDFGYITAFGQISGIDTNPASSATNICAAGETWIDGDILYASPSVSGKLTKVKPQHETIVAIVLNTADNGSLFVRPIWYPHIDDLHDINTSGVSNNQYLIYNSGTQLWTPTSSGIFNNVYASGKVGIGVTSPSTTLHVSGVTTLDGDLKFATITNRISWDNGTEYITRQGDNIALGTQGTNKLFVSSQGGVGIGTDGPADKLDVRVSSVFNEAGADLDFRIEGDTNANLFFIDASTDRIGIGTSTPSTIIDVSGVIKSFGTNFSIAIDGVSGAGPRISIGSSADYTAYMDIGAYSNINNINTKGRDFRLHSTSIDPILYAEYDTGNVGIGTTTPGSKLEVNGEIAAGFTSAFTFAGNSWGYDKIIFRKDVNNKITSDSSGNYNWLVAGKNWTLSDVDRVGLGTIVPQSGFKLDINGSTVARGDILSNGSISEFGNDRYRLSSGSASNSYSYVSNATGARFGVGFSAPSGKLSVSGGVGIGANYNLVPPTNGLIVEGNVGIGTSAPTVALDVRGASIFNEAGADFDFRVEGDNDANLFFVDASVDRIGIGTTTPAYKLQVNGSFGATTKSFRIDHPSRPNYTLEYGSLESPYHGVRLTGRGKIAKGVCVVDLPPYLKDLIHDDENINIQITNLKHGKTLYVSDIDLNNSQFVVKCDRAKTLPELEFFWTFSGVRKDVDHLVVEKPKEV